MHYGCSLKKEFHMYIETQGVRVLEIAEERGAVLVLFWGRGRGSLDSD